MQRNTKPPDTPPLISCLMVTQQGRLDDTRQAIDCFSCQQLNPLELVIVHDSGATFHDELLQLIEGFTGTNIKVFQQPHGHTLGWLRNQSLEHAEAELVCQWDDDDLNHPARLMKQHELMQQEESDFCFMTDQLHLFTEQGFLFWDDWCSQVSPNDLIENTMLGKRTLMGDYPDQARGEDTTMIEQIFNNHHKISRLSGMGWLYTYIFNGKNAWDFQHHSEVSFHNRLKTDDLLARKDMLEKKLKEYGYSFDQLCMPHDRGKIELRIKD